MARYFTDGGPGPATMLVRVDIGDAEQDNDIQAFYAAPAWAFTDHGWVKDPGAQDYILQEGEMDRIPNDQVERAQAEVLQNYQDSVARLAAMRAAT